SSRLRIIERLGQQRDVVLLDDAEPHAAAVQLTLLAQGHPAGSGAHEVIFMPHGVWSLYGAQRLQPVAISGKCSEAETAANKPKPLPSIATSCRVDSMVSRASAVGCHPLREVPSLRRRRSTSRCSLRVLAVRSRRRGG